MPRVRRVDIILASDEEQYKHYEAVDALYRQGKEVSIKEHKSGFPAVTVDCGDIHLLTDCLSLEAWWTTFGKQRTPPEQWTIFGKQRTPPAQAAKGKERHGPIPFDREP